MKQATALLGFLLFVPLFPIAQRVTPADGDWTKQYVVLKNTPEAELMIRVGDIDNLSFGWSEGFNPFSGRSTESHNYPWEINKADARGTDRIMVPTGYKYGSGASTDGYTENTRRPGNNPIPIVLSLKDLKDVNVASAVLQMFIDDFQSPGFQKKYQLKINGLRFVEAEKLINSVDQNGPIGKMIAFRFSEELLQMLKGDSLTVFIDDPVTSGGDGFAIDFIKLLINPKALLYKGNINGTIVDETTRKPIANATAEVKEYSTVTTDADGNFLLKNIPAGLDIVYGSATGYSAGQKQADVIEDETTGDVIIELKRSGKVTFDNKSLREGDNLVMNNIQFEVNSATLLAPGKQELDKLATFMNQNETVEILLAGHTSSEGYAASNRQLSLKRVRSCKDYLIAKGIDDGRITIKGYGPDMPVAPNDTEINRAKNRRVEMKITRL